MVASLLQPPLGVVVGSIICASYRMETRGRHLLVFTTVSPASSDHLCTRASLSGVALLSHVLSVAVGG